MPPNATTRQQNGLPYLPITLRYQGQSVTVNGLLDTGAAINVLPYSLGQQLGLNWENKAPISQLAGNLAAFESRGVRLTGIVELFPACRLALAWTRNESVPLILGQVNFFQIFQVCFDGADQFFTLQPKF
ncbi:hypothetical protein IQ250_24050 [Pseudanabaenaceae cyanobacterium LEGE 13415]|nr:hypothetical protein [Pseudanabaenaceae cyanobacterium LEGE 13415]